MWCRVWSSSVFFSVFVLSQQTQSYYMVSTLTRSWGVKLQYWCLYCHEPLLPSQGCLFLASCRWSKLILQYTQYQIKSLMQFDLLFLWPFINNMKNLGHMRQALTRSLILFGLEANIKSILELQACCYYTARETTKVAKTPRMLFSARTEGMTSLVYCCYFIFQCIISPWKKVAGKM